MIVANDVTRPGAGFGTDTNIATLITRSGMLERPLQSKRALAEDILDQILKLRKG
jgi:phosphopantothenoylcysteine decarboxylase/phosphopantothenate--cysteine ligase